MFVIYKHIRLDTNEVFYIGMGNTERPYIKQNRNTHWKRIVKKHGYRVEIIMDNLCREQAYQIEIMLISQYGRKDQGMGTLVNLGDGGEGGNNRKGKKHTTETIAKIKEARKGQVFTKETRDKMKTNNSHCWVGKTHSDETKKKMSKSMTGIKKRNLTMEERERRSEVMKNYHKNKSKK